MDGEKSIEDQAREGVIACLHNVLMNESTVARAARENVLLMEENLRILAFMATQTYTLDPDVRGVLTERHAENVLAGARSEAVCAVLCELIAHLTLKDAD